MTTEKDLNDKKLLLKLTGKLDSRSASELENELVSLLPGIEELTFDLEGLDYISSSGLRALYTAD